MGLREQKKEQTRHRLIATAWRLFAEHGFDGVTVNQIARQAAVAPATVFNYFPAKEDLFYEPLEAFGRRLVEAIRDRDPGESALTALQRVMTGSDDELRRIQDGDAEALRRMQTLSRIIADSPALRSRERQVLERHTATLAAEFSTADDVPIDAWVAANAIMGVHHGALVWVRRQVLAGRTANLADEMRRAVSAAVTMLENGLRDVDRSTDEEPA